MIIAVALFATNAVAQEGFGLMGGVNFSSSSTKGMAWKPGGFVGGLYDVCLSEGLYFQPRLVLSYQENENKEKTRYYSQWAVTVPLLASFQFNISENATVRLNVGPYIRYAAFGRYKYWTIGTDGKTVNEGGLGWWHGSFGDRTHVGLQAGIQATFGRWFATADYMHSFKRMEVNVGGFENTVLLGVGVKF